MLPIHKVAETESSTATIRIERFLTAKQINVPSASKNAHVLDTLLICRQS